jgi:hypothetical protein
MARRALAELEQRAPLAVLHRICNVYAVLGVAVPVFGFATAASLHVLGSAWLVAAMALTAAAAVLLGAVILPVQQRLLAALFAATMGAAAPGSVDVTVGAATLDRARIRRLAMYTGTFNLLWAAVTVLMIVRPGSTTGA